MFVQLWCTADSDHSMFIVWINEWKTDLLNGLPFIPGSERSPWRRKWQPTPVFLPGKSHGQRSTVGSSAWGRRESDTTEQLHFHFSLSLPILKRKLKWLTSYIQLLERIKSTKTAFTRKPSYLIRLKILPNVFSMLYLKKLKQPADNKIWISLSNTSIVKRSVCGTDFAAWIEKQDTRA